MSGGVQKGALPRKLESAADPSLPIGLTKYHRAFRSGKPGALPSETYQYDIVYETFRNDEDFWRNWNVKACQRADEDASMAEDNAAIRVVMDLPAGQKLFPTTYTPGFTIRPALTEDAQDGQRATTDSQRRVDGLLPGYSVALEVHLLEEAKIMLKNQRAFRAGGVEPRFRWLDDVVKVIDAEDNAEAGHKPQPRAKQKSGRQKFLVETEELRRPEANLRPPIGDVPRDYPAPRKSRIDDILRRDLPGDSAGDSKNETPKESREGGMSERFLEVYEEMAMVIPFGSGSGMPSRVTGLWAQRAERAPTDASRSIASEGSLAVLDRR
jgi:hypothetical protein